MLTIKMTLLCQMKIISVSIDTTQSRWLQWDCKQKKDGLSNLWRPLRRCARSNLWDPNISATQCFSRHTQSQPAQWTHKKAEAWSQQQDLNSSWKIPPIPRTVTWSLSTAAGMDHFSAIQLGNLIMGADMTMIGFQVLPIKIRVHNFAHRNLVNTRPQKGWVA